jgi:hypothetical protein
MREAVLEKLERTSVTAQAYPLPAEGTFWQSADGSGHAKLMSHLSYHFNRDNEACEAAIREARQRGEVGLTSENAPFRELLLEVSPDEDPAKPWLWRLSES